MARKFNDKMTELQATTGLGAGFVATAPRCEQSGKLADIYNWFTEGFDTADLKEAKALLDELSVLVAHHESVVRNG